LLLAHRIDHFGAPQPLRLGLLGNRTPMVSLRSISLISTVVTLMPQTSVC
jgi:hypothetical protein